MPKELLTVAEAAARYRVHQDTMYRWVKDGTIEHERIGPRTIRIVVRDTTEGEE